MIANKNAINNIIHIASNMVLYFAFYFSTYIRDALKVKPTINFHKVQIQGAQKFERANFQLQNIFPHHHHHHWLCIFKMLHFVS